MASGKGIQRMRQLAAVVANDAEAVEVEIAAHLRESVQSLITEIRVFEAAALAKRQQMRQLLHTGHGIDIAEDGWHVLADGSKAVRQAADLRPERRGSASRAERRRASRVGDDHGGSTSAGAGQHREGGNRVPR